MKKSSCEKCLYSTDFKNHFEQHKLSKTHIKKENNDFEGKFKCKFCDKTYKSNNGYYSHRNKCKKRDDEERKKEKRRRRNKKNYY